ncbi:MAG: acyltransferase, partial [Bryobacteraceae bacterium]
MNSRIARSSALHQFFSRIAGLAEFYAVYALGRVCGNMHVVRYLRNPNPRVTTRLMRAFGAAVGQNTTIKGRIFVDNVHGDENSTGDFSHLIIGDNCFIGDGVFFDLADTIVIQDCAVIAGGAAFLTHAECNRSNFLRRHFPRRCEGVVIGSRAWIGFNATILAGVNIGSNTAIGAQSLVLKDAEPKYVYA